MEVQHVIWALIDIRERCASTMATEYTHLSLEERIEIEKRVDLGWSRRRIARTLNRSVATVSRELKRNSWTPVTENASYTVYRDPALNRESVTQYRAGRAEARAKSRAVNSHRARIFTNDWMVNHVVSQLKNGKTPGMIAGRLGIDFPGVVGRRVCAETIYQWIYSLPQRFRELAQYLPRAHKRRRKLKGRRVHSSHIPNRVSIHHRSDKANARSEFGHFEGDSVVGLRSVGDGIHAEVERTSRMVFARKVSALTSEEGVAAQLFIFGSLPAGARKSTTMDNGTEMHLHRRLVERLGMETFFADPYSSWQRGTNEHHNGRIRRYFPKGTNCDLVSQEELDAVVEAINNEPRKCLGWFTPAEVFQEQLELLETQQCCTSE
jgi:transposase, IS30 family